MKTLIWLKYERTFAWLINTGAYYSLVSFNRDGIEYEILIENDEYEIIEEPFEQDGEHE